VTTGIISDLSPAQRARLQLRSEASVSGGHPSPKRRESIFVNFFTIKDLA